MKAASRTGKPVGAAEGVIFEYRNPKNYGPAFEEVDRAYVLVPSGIVDPTKELMLPVIEAAADRKVKVVLQSVPGADGDDSVPYRQIEIARDNSGAAHVIVRPNWFADNFHTFWKPGIDNGQIAPPAGEVKSSGSFALGCGIIC